MNEWSHPQIKKSKQYLSIEWLHTRISFTEFKVRPNLQGKISRNGTNSVSVLSWIVKTGAPSADKNETAFHLCVDIVFLVTEKEKNITIALRKNRFVSFRSFGAKIRSKELGIIYNDQLLDAVNMWVTEYHLEPDSFIPRKRPLSMASPSIILDEAGNVKMVFGAAGGKYIATTLAQVNK